MYIRYVLYPSPEKSTLLPVIITYLFGFDNVTCATLEHNFDFPQDAFSISLNRPLDSEFFITPF